MRYRPSPPTITYTLQGLNFSLHIGADVRHEHRHCVGVAGARRICLCSGLPFSHREGLRHAHGPRVGPAVGHAQQVRQALARHSGCALR